MPDQSILRVVPSAENHSRGQLWWRGRAYSCALGRGGVMPASRKREGDDASPAGIYPLLGLYYRPDRLDRPATELPVEAMSEQLGWCDDVACAEYNSAVELPHQGSAESLWRADGVYDLLVVIGHNIDPAIAGLGSAIFMHVARDDFFPTRGCVAVSKEALLEILPELDRRAALRIHLP